MLCVMHKYIQIQSPQRKKPQFCDHRKKVPECNVWWRPDKRTAAAEKTLEGLWVQTYCYSNHLEPTSVCKHAVGNLKSREGQRWRRMQFSAGLRKEPNATSECHGVFGYRPRVCIFFLQAFCSPMFKIMHDVYSVHACMCYHRSAGNLNSVITEKRCRSAMFDEGLIKEPLQQKKNLQGLWVQAYCYSNHLEPTSVCKHAVGNLKSREGQRWRRMQIIAGLRKEPNATSECHGVFGVQAQGMYLFLASFLLTHVQDYAWCVQCNYMRVCAIIAAQETSILWSPKKGAGVQCLMKAW